MTGQDWLNVLVPYLVPVIFGVAGTLCLVGYQHLLKYLPEKQRAMLDYAVQTAVVAVEQTMPTAIGQDKKIEAVDRTQEILSHFGLNIPSAVIDSAIEATVKGMNIATVAAQQKASVQ